jgi:hypothetical protein
MGAKHKKTRREKIIADYRHQVYILKNNNISPSISNSTPTIAISENDYFNTHIVKDVLKTGILTCSIIAAQIVLFFLLKNHAIKLPMLNY